jgi:hypothetical protein
VTTADADIVGPDRPVPLEEEQLPGGIAGLWQRTWLNIRTGNLGSLPIIVGEIAVIIIFGLTATNFFTAVNFVNLITETAGTALLAYGVVFVLLLGEIDLSIGFVSGIAGVVVAELQTGGNCELTRADETVMTNGVTILGPTNLPSTVPYHASQMYARNVVTLAQHLVQREKGPDGKATGAPRLVLNLEDEITKEILVTKGGEIVQARVRELAVAGASPR